MYKRGYRTALINFDGQGHSSIIFGIKNPNQVEVTINTIIRKLIEDEPLPVPDSYIVKTKCGVDLILSNTQRFTLERNLCNVNFRKRMLSRYVDTIRYTYEYIIIDCMPQMGTPMITMDSPNTILSAQVHKLINHGFAGRVPIFKTHILRSIKVAEAVLYHQTIFEFLPENPVAIAYESFAYEFLLCEKKGGKAVDGNE